MTVSRILDQFRLTGIRPNTAQRASAVGLAAVTGAATLALGFAPDAERNDTRADARPATTSTALPASPAAQADDTSIEQGGLRARVSTAYQQAQADAIEAEQADKTEQAGKADEAAATEQDEARAEAEREAKAEREKAATEQAADRSHEREKAATPEYPNNLDGWIREALAIMEREGIPGSYEGIHRNIMRESSGNPRAINTWDINARNGVPSKGLLQVIQPTFEAYHVEGTSWDLYDPVANIVAACNYAADRYGSMDNVDSAY
ncbi:transglycosylase SLT domain-containing protein [Streptomyces sp. TRM43335]|uniref:Transglycosylase SLT domain-containing protein n=1 Tax=Streptomyces taklimakanensis TaxID=2569853 RepID=A0A6G2B8U4_9ACTN|nr:transglycosylase SLT domain-containing protein [Streptomyces taklimakanensis]MTE18668.1 transglycosylase SLT domain-containing protein [Streptomyces taklimakanensis]